jgi:hypothetical protein
MIFWTQPYNDEKTGGVSGYIPLSLRVAISSHLAFASLIGK